MIIFTEEMKKNPVAFLKFADELWKLESLQNGTLYMNTLGYFRKKEEEEKNKGMGDKNEGSLPITNINIKFYNRETNKLVYEGPALRCALTLAEDLQKHVFCLFYLDFSSLKIIEEGTNYIKTLLTFTDEQIKDIEKSFGKYVLIISWADFLNKVKEAFNKENIEWCADKVKYCDFTINNQERIDDFLNNRTSKYFWKDKYFENQKEYRIVVLNKDSDEPIQLNIGDLSNCSFITTTEALFSNQFIINVEFNPETDLIEIDE